MEKSNRLAFRTKVILGFVLIVFFLLFVIGRTYLDISKIQTSQTNLYEYQFSNSIKLKDIRSNQNAIRADLLEMMLTSDSSKLDAFEQDIRKREKENDDELNILLDNNRKNPVLYRKLEEFQTIRNAFAETRDEQIIPLIREGRVEEANALVLGIQLQRNKKMGMIVDDLIAVADSSAHQAVQAANVLASHSKQISLVTGGIIIAISFIMAWILYRMIGSLSREIREGTNVLASAASEIVATTSQVASGATETASAVTETTSTVEEVKKTAELSSEKARYVSDTAQKAAEVSQSGQQAVDKSIEGVNQVRQQMGALAESIVQLSEQSQAIGEIIASVNDLAEQSNLLAVNAGIEAAKAGEQGKGFGVVAQEIRTLAEQSKQATGQVRAILSDIQKATSASVLAAEQGSKAVENGVQQTEQAGDAIKALAQSITEAAQAATQIAASSQQQQAGMNQIALAIENIREASTQNVTGTKQAESAAHDLSELGQKLKGIIEHYRL